MNYKYDPKNPRTVAELNDASTLRVLATRLDNELTEMPTAAAREAVINAITILNGAARAMTP